MNATVIMYKGVKIVGMPTSQKRRFIWEIKNAAFDRTKTYEALSAAKAAVRTKLEEQLASALPACMHCGGSGYEIEDHESHPCRAGCGRRKLEKDEKTACALFGNSLQVTHGHETPPTP